MMNLIMSLFKMFSSVSKVAKQAESSKPKIVAPTVFITLQDWITSSGRYPERAKSAELTEEVKANAEDLIKRVNNLLNIVGWTEKVTISSGFRPSGVNANVAGAAKRSAHMIGKAMDIQQPKASNKLGLLIRKIQDNKGKAGILGQSGLMMEALESTIGQNTAWAHLDTVVRTERPSMEFKP